MPAPERCHVIGWAVSSSGLMLLTEDSDGKRHKVRWTLAPWVCRVISAALTGRGEPRG